MLFLLSESAKEVEWVRWIHQDFNQGSFVSKTNELCHEENESFDLKSFESIIIFFLLITPSCVKLGQPSKHLITLPLSPEESSQVHSTLLFSNEKGGHSNLLQPWKYVSVLSISFPNFPADGWIVLSFGLCMYVRGVCKCIPYGMQLHTYSHWKTFVYFFLFFCSLI